MEHWGEPDGVGFEPADLTRHRLGAIACYAPRCGPVIVVGDQEAFAEVLVSSGLRTASSMCPGGLGQVWSKPWDWAARRVRGVGWNDAPVGGQYPAWVS